MKTQKASILTRFDPPAGLSERALGLWHEIAGTHARSPGRLAMLQEGLRALDRAEAARIELETAGMVSKTQTSGALHCHPLVKVERESRQQFLRAFEVLNLKFAGDDRLQQDVWERKLAEAQEEEGN